MDSQPHFFFCRYCRSIETKAPIVCCGDKMVEFRWDDSLEIGNQIVDAQHKELVDMFANLITDFYSEKPTYELEQALNFLDAYTVNHFNTEEQLTQSLQFKEFEKHKGMHETLKKTVAELIGKFQREGPSGSLAMELNTKIGDWLLVHIRREDAKIKPYLK